MPARAPTQRETKPERWSDWFPDAEPSETLDQLIDLLAAQGINDVDRATIRFWQSQGVIPHPERRRIGRGVYAVYPTIAADVIRLIREMQEDGRTLKEIAPRIRAIAPRLARNATMRANTEPMGDIGNHVAAIAREQEELTGTPVQRVEVTFVDTHGRRTTYEVDAAERWR